MRQELCFRRVDPDGAYDANLARRGAVQTVSDDFASLQIGQIAGREPQVTRQDAADRDVDVRVCRGEQRRVDARQGDDAQEAHRLNVIAPALASRSRYSATAARSIGSNSALTASRISRTVLTPSTKFTIS